MKPQQLREEFRKLCQQPGQWPDALDTAWEQDRNTGTFTVTWRICKIQLVYSFKWGALAPPSVLYCRIFPDKNCNIWLHLPELMALLERDDFRSCFFPCIENPGRLGLCFDALAAIVKDYIPTLEKLGSSGEDRTLLLKWVKEWLVFIGMEENDPDQILQNGSDPQMALLAARRMTESNLVARYTELPAYDSFLRGDREKALRGYGKQKQANLFPYERRLYRFLASEDSREFRPISDGCYARREMLEISQGKADFVTSLKGVCLMELPWGGGCCLLMAVIHWIFGRGTVCYFGIPWYFGLLWGLLPAMVSAALFRRRIIPIVGGKNAVKQMEFDDIICHSSKTDGFLRVLFAVVSAAVVLFSVWMPTLSMRLYDSWGDYAGEGLLERERFSYDEIQAIYHIDARYNVYGHRVERGSYVIVMEDGRCIDFDGDVSEKETECQALPIFEALGIPVIHVDSDRELPGEGLNLE